MAATLFRAVCFLALIGPTIHCLANLITSTEIVMWTYCIFCEIHAVLKCVWGDIMICLLLLFAHVNCIWDSRSRIGFCISKWSKHGKTVLAIPAHNPLIDVTICMDVHPNPGPAVNDGNEHN